jgi:tetratricopeptide (TPR) repeat protein
MLTPPASAPATDSLAPSRDAAPSPPTSQTGGTGIVRKTLVSLLAVALLWLIVTQGLAATLAVRWPDAALWLNPNQPVALLQLAEQTLAADLATGSPAARHDVRPLVTRALRHDPLSPQAQAILAEVAERQGDRAGARLLLDKTLQRSVHEGAAAYKLMVYAAQAGEYVKATGYAELLLRTRPDAFPVVLPVLISLADIEAAHDALTAMLARKPYGRASFFLELPPKVRDPRTPQRLLLALKDTANPPTNPELKAYLNQLVSLQQHGLAYYTWLQFTPTEVFESGNLLFNGQFLRPTTELPFDWNVDAQSGATVQLITVPDDQGQQGLNLEFGSGRIEFGGVVQVLVLAPGTYQFNGQYKGSLIGRRGLQWRMTCGDLGTTLLLETPPFLGIQSNWQDIAVTFTVPEAGCRGQQLALRHVARSASELFLSGSAWYRALSIKRTPGPP